LASNAFHSHLAAATVAYDAGCLGPAVNPGVPISGSKNAWQCIGPAPHPKGLLGMPQYADCIASSLLTLQVRVSTETDDSGVPSSPWLRPLPQSPRAGFFRICNNTACDPHDSRSSLAALADNASAGIKGAPIRCIDDLSFHRRLECESRKRVGSEDILAVEERRHRLPACVDVSGPAYTIESIPVYARHEEFSFRFMLTTQEEVGR
jgi:hypothetical protein